MAGLFSAPKPPAAVPPPNPGDTQNRLNNALAAKLQSGGSNADNTSNNTLAPVGAARQPTLTGLG